jgi:exonuclease SbcD
VEKGADALVLCGDTFKDISPSATVLKMFASRLHRLTSQGVRVVIMLGNHDSPKTVGRAAPQEVFDELRLEGVHIFSKPDFIDLKSKEGLGVRVFALPYRHPIHVAAKVEKATSARVELDREALLGAFQADIRKTMNVFTMAGRKDADVGILAAHLFVEGARRGAERIYIVGEEFAVPPSMIQSEAFDYVALGHVHAHQVVPGRVPTVYAGSLERVDFSEVDEQKGFVDVTYEKGRLAWEFIPVKARPMVRLDVDCTEAENPDRLVAGAIEKARVKDAIVRLVLRVKPETVIGLDEIHDRLSSAFWHQVVFNRISESQPISASVSWVSLNPHETFARYLKALKLSEEDRELIAKLGDEIVDAVMAEGEKA